MDKNTLNCRIEKRSQPENTGAEYHQVFSVVTKHFFESYAAETLTYI